MHRKFLSGICYSLDICLVTDHQGTPARPVPHGVPRGETAVRDAGLTAHHRLAGRPVSGGVTEPPPVPENKSGQVRSGQVCEVIGVTCRRV